MFRILFIALSVNLVAGASGLQTVREEQNLEKRSQLALVHADREIDAARKAYDEGNLGGFRSHVDIVADAAELSYQSLQDTGKRARRSPKWFKRAEKDMRMLLRRLTSLEDHVFLDDRPQVASVRKRVQDVHDQVLHDIMSKK